MNRPFKDFLSTILYELESMLSIDNDKDGRPDFRYHLFILLAVGIEMLGATFDDYDWHEKNKSKERFNTALSKIDSLKKYQQKELYEHLRCGMAHVYVPNYEIGINTKSEGGKNLEMNNGQTLIQIEEFFLDFKKASEEVIDSINGENKLGLSDKAFKDFLRVPFSPALASASAL
jgi:hypothetical protein